MTMASMSKSAVIACLAERAGWEKKNVARLFDLLSTLAAEEAKNVFVLPNFGRLTLADRKARMGRNPSTGATIEIPAKRVVKFRVAKVLKDAILA
jgi:DNA-binding protein HU-beta